MSLLSRIPAVSPVFFLFLLFYFLLCLNSVVWQWIEWQIHEDQTFIDFITRLCVGGGKLGHTFTSRPAQQVLFNGTFYAEPVHGGWSDWSYFSPCRVTCGQGLKERHRMCTKPRSACGGRLCEGGQPIKPHQDVQEDTDVQKCVAPVACKCG